VIAAACSVGLALGVRHHVMGSPRFSVRHFEVKGNARRTVQQVVAWSGVANGANIFRVNPEDVRVRLEQDPWIAMAEVERKLPSTLRIFVRERDAAAVVSVGSDLYLATSEGELFKRLEPGDPNQLVVVTGIDDVGGPGAKEWARKQLKRAFEVIELFERRGPGKKMALQQVHLAADGTIRLVAGGDAMSIELGREPYAQKIMRASRVVEEVTRRHARASAIFLDNEAHPERVVVRMR
jgi:cell division protein FtsQ